MDLSNMSPDQLYRLGEQIAEISKERPDISHRICLGMCHAFGDQGVFVLGELLWTLWRHGTHIVPENLRIPFSPLAETPSGSKG